MGKVMVNTIKGAAIGFVGAIGIFIIGFCIELFNVGYAILSCDCDKQTIFDWSGMWGLLVICTIAGAIIGCVYGFYKAKQESDSKIAERKKEIDEEARKQRVRWAGEVKQSALNLNNTCSKNKMVDKPLVATTYKSSEQMTKIMYELTKISERQGEVDYFAKELSKREGASL